MAVMVLLLGALTVVLRDRSGSADFCPSQPSASSDMTATTTNGPETPSGSPDTPKLTALEIAQRLPPMPSLVSPVGGRRLVVVPPRSCQRESSGCGSRPDRSG